MAFRQLYYTSCEHGLSGYPGYQFNAVTPGLGGEVLRTVEMLVAYEPPPSVGHNPTPAAIDSAPINLCYRRGDDATVIANVHFVGADFSQRSGNYFAHALVTTDPDRDLDGILPIELWAARFWAREPVSSTEPTELTELSAAVLCAAAGAVTNRAAVARFLADHHAAGQLPALLSAVDRAVDVGDRSVVVVETDADRAALWIGAASHLLPMPLAQRMSFATYLHQPSYSRLHLIGTVPDADIVRGEAGLDEFYLFDMTSGVATPVDVHPAAELLCELGTVAAGRVWERAASVAEGGELTLAEWYPVVVTAALLDGFSPPERHWADAVAWLEGQAKRLGPEVVDAFGVALVERSRSEPGSQARTLVRLLAALPPDLAATGVLAEVLSAALVRPPPDDGGQQLDDHLRLWQALTTHPVRGQLGRDARIVLNQLRWVDEKERWRRSRRSFAAVETAAKDFIAGYDVLYPAVQAHVRAHVRAHLQVLLRRLAPAVLADVLAGCPPPIITAFAADLRDVLTADATGMPDPTGPMAAARAYATMWHLDRDGAAEPGDAVGHALASGLAEWQDRELAEVPALIEEDYPALAADFEVWWRRQVSP